ncbi:MAG: LAGLIDADG family homing endonuclease [Nanoarchaeota archaeon]|nr:LAGLIDADG family homing endonuclease [Nanoarchaeota archaeon]
MSRLKKEVKTEIIHLIKSGKSLNKIIKETGIGKTTIYYYIRKIRGRKYKPIKINFNDDELIGEIIGLFAGDGYYLNNEKRSDYRIKIYFNSKEDKLIEYYRTSFYKLTTKFPGVVHSRSVKIMQMSGKSICNFVLGYLSFGKRKTATVSLKNKSYYKNKDFMKGFLRGLVDSDGYVRKGRKEIYYGSISKMLFKDFLKGLDIFNFRYKTYLQKSKYSDFYKVRISGDEVDKFTSFIKPVKRL